MTTGTAGPYREQVTAWSPGDGGPDVLSLGGRGTSRLSTAQTVARLLLCLAVGVFLGAHFFGGTVVAQQPRVPEGAGPVGAGPVGAGPVGAGPVGAGPRGRPARAGDLTGTWLRSGVRGVWRGIEGRELMRFDADGGFTWGRAGPYRALRGRYLLSGGTVTVTVLRTNLCHAGDTYTWRATLTRAGRLHLAHVPGTERDGCAASPEVWSGRRLEVAPVPSLLRARE